MRHILTVLILGLWATAAPAQNGSVAQYDVTFLGINAGTLEVSGQEAGGSYSSRARFATTGLVKALKTMRFNLTAKGQLGSDGLRPAQYTEDIDNGRRVTKLEIRFKGGVAVQVTGDPGSKAPPVDPASIPGALDPLSVFHAVTRDQPAAKACRFSADIYDGHRHSILQLQKARPTQDGVSCSGVYVRKTGYTAKELKRSPVPITVDYVQVGDMMRAVKIAVKSTRGTAVLRRR